MCAVPGQGKEKSSERGAVTSPTTHTIQTKIYLLKKTQGGGIVADNRIWPRKERNQDMVRPQKERKAWPGNNNQNKRGVGRTRIP